ncbi:GFP-like fluorescent chromoprotein FP506, partial [Stylophora pistillata]
SVQLGRRRSELQQIISNRNQVWKVKPFILNMSHSKQGITKDMTMKYKMEGCVNGHPFTIRGNGNGNPYETKQPVTLPQNHVVEHRIVRTGDGDKVNLVETAEAHVNPLTKQPVTLPPNHVVEHRILRTGDGDKINLVETAEAHVNPLTKQPVTLPPNHVVEHRILRTGDGDKINLVETAEAHVNPLMPATSLTLLVAHRVREQVKVQVHRSGKMKIWGGSRTQRANTLSSQIAFCEKGELYIEYRRMSCKERSSKLRKFCEKDETTSAPLTTRRPYPDYGKLPNFHYLSWSATSTDGREPEDFQPRAQIKRSFEESESVSGDSEAIRKFSDKYTVLEKLVAEYVEHLAHIKMRKEKKKEETETGVNGTAEPGVQ